MAVALMLEPVLNCHSVLPVAASSATNSPVSFPVNTSPPPVASMPADPGKSASGTSHFFSPVNGSIAAKCPSTSPGRTGGTRAVTPVEFPPGTSGFGGAIFCTRGTSQVLA